MLLLILREHFVPHDLPGIYELWHNTVSISLLDYSKYSKALALADQNIAFFTVSFCVLDYHPRDGKWATNSISLG